jgi:hypothetical protein
MIILAAALVFAIGLWAWSCRSAPEPEKIAVRVRSNKPKQRNSRIIND